MADDDVVDRADIVARWTDQMIGTVAHDQIPRVLAEAQELRTAVAIAAKVPWWEEECIRVEGGMPCPMCGQQWRQHPQPAPREVPTLVRGCDGRQRKL